MQKIFSVFCCTFVPSGLLNNDLINHLVVAVRFSKLTRVTSVYLPSIRSFKQLLFRSAHDAITNLQLEGSGVLLQVWHGHAGVRHAVLHLLRQRNLEPGRRHPEGLLPWVAAKPRFQCRFYALKVLPFFFVELSKFRSHTIRVLRISVSTAVRLARDAWNVNTGWYGKSKMTV